jgi:hypothetical protein
MLSTKAVEREIPATIHLALFLASAIREDSDTWGDVNAPIY